ncbi:SDR family oxidoreductase [Altererythrobacter lutimaris]|uniref:SDR family oxidoreductase n=1 Tax=Altererythrobacter lutimaris TaxID=2743979 RepID=A0A850H3K7_9SPHN|nr:SDR family oxidoreductase [Altererythrobacter lutimaris]NVE93754.1 SDR family oxidoreductase [Altererythrobacter lutimaris]
MPNINRRTLLAGAAATGAFVATASFAQSDIVTADIDMSGKSVLITGTSTGFGRLMAEDYARKGAKVFATMRNLPRPEADELEALAANEGLDITVIEIDVTDEEQVAAGVAKAEALNEGAIDVLINNAGTSVGGPIEIQDMEATRLLFDVNTFGPHRMARAALPAMRAAKSGLIVNVTSQLGRVIAPGYAQYSPSKFALEAMSEQMAYELVPHGVDVLIIEPGGYPTMIWKNANENALALLERAEEKHTSGYQAMIAQLGQRTGGGSTDPMDVPNAIAEIIAMPPGTRPLRREVHPGAKPQIAINEVSAKVQVGWLGESPFGPWIKAVHNV